ncbi:MAG: helix-turn-helix domain-containing protein [Methylosarcina sp.]
MSRKKLDFTLEEVQQEVVHICNILSDEILEVLGKNFYLACLDQPLVSYIENDSSGCRDLTINDLNECPISHDVSCAFDYARGFRFGNINIPDDFLDGMGQFYVLTKGLIDRIEDSKYKFLFDVSNARAALDNGDDLSLKELAILAGVDERTVRNAASSKDATSLKTKKSGGSTIVDSEEAKRWLASRPDFKPTEYIEDTTLDTSRYFEDATGFGRYLIHRRKELGLAIEEVADAIDVSTDIVSDLENGIDRLHLNQVGKLSLVLKEDRSRFMKDYMRIFHPQELADLMGYDYHANDTPDNPEKLTNFKLMVFKHKLNLEAKMEIIEDQKKGK